MTPPLKIAHVSCVFPPRNGGMGNSAFNFVNYLSRYDYQITVFTPDYPSNRALPVLNREIFFEPAKITIVRLRPWLHLGNAACLPQLLWRLRQFDIVHLHYPFYGSAEIVWLAKVILRQKFKLITHYHMDNVGSDWRSHIFALYRVTILPWLARCSSLITCASLDYIKHSALGEYYHHQRQKFACVPFGVDIARFSPRVCSTLTGEKTILFVGGLDAHHYFKGVENLILAFAALSGAGSDWRLRLVGRGDLENYYQKIIAQNNLTAQVTIDNHISNEALVDCYNDCAFLVLPSIDRSEAFGLVLLEAMACGQAVIASNLPGVRNVFKNEVQGLLVRPNNVADLTAKLLYLIKRAEVRRKMGLAGRQLVVNRYTWDKAAEILNNLYMRVKYSLR